MFVVLYAKNPCHIGKSATEQLNGLNSQRIIFPKSPKHFGVHTIFLGYCNSLSAKEIAFFQN